MNHNSKNALSLLCPVEISFTHELHQASSSKMTYKKVLSLLSNGTQIKTKFLIFLRGICLFQDH